MFFYITAYLFRFWPSSGGIKVGPKVLPLGPSLFHKYSNPSKIFQPVILFARVLTLVRILAILNHIWGARAQKPPKKCYFVDAGSVRKTSEIFNLTTTITTLRHESVNRKAPRARNSFFWLNLIASLVNLLYKLDDIWGSIPQNTTQKKGATLTSLRLEPKLLSSRVT